MKTAALLIALSASATHAQEISVTDTLGRDVNLTAVPERIVSTSHLHFFDLLSLGIVPVGTEWPGPMQHVGFEEAISQELTARGMEVPDLSNTISITSGQWELDWEKIASLEPDLITVIYSEQADVAETLAPTYGTLASSSDEVDSLEMVEQAFIGLGQAVGRETRAREFFADVLKRVEAYHALSPKDRTVQLIFSDGQGSVSLAGQQSLACQLWEDFAPCASSDQPSYWMSASVESLLAVDPDVILILGRCLGSMCEKKNALLIDALAADPLWQELTAVTEDRVHVLEYDVRAYSAATLGHQFDATAPLIYPEVFLGPLSDQEVRMATGG